MPPKKDAKDGKKDKKDDAPEYDVVEQSQINKLGVRLNILMLLGTRSGWN
jgi:hypothetical protein